MVERRLGFGRLERDGSTVGRARPEIRRSLSLGLPLVTVGIILLAYAVDPEFYLRYFETELGVIENVQAALGIVPIVFVGLALRYGRLLPKLWLRGWLLLMVVGCVYMIGEELSWGQHWLGWSTPEALEKLNDQGETNLHNMSSWLDQKPRLLLELGILIGGIILPVVFFFSRPRWLGDRNDWRWWFVPTSVCFPAAVMAIVIRLPERAVKALGVDTLSSVPLRFSELQELCFVIFLILYTASIHARLKAIAAEPSAASPR